MKSNQLINIHVSLILIEPYSLRINNYCIAAAGKSAPHSKHAKFDISGFLTNSSDNWEDS